LNGFKSVTVSPETYDEARRLVELGIEKNIGQAFANAISQYAYGKREMIKEMEAVKTKWANKC
jgi:hypothetical protein